MTTIQDRVRLITGLVADCVGRQMQEACAEDPVRLQLSTLFLEVIDGVYVEDTKISREELISMPVDDWVKFLAQKRKKPRGPVQIKEHPSTKPLPEPKAETNQKPKKGKKPAKVKA